MELTACRHPVHDKQTNFQNITEILFLPSSFWYFIDTANCLLLGAHVLIVMGALQIYIDDDDDDSGLRLSQEIVNTRNKEMQSVAGQITPSSSHIIIVLQPR